MGDPRLAGEHPVNRSCPLSDEAICVDCEDRANSPPPWMYAANINATNATNSTEKPF